MCLHLITPHTFFVGASKEQRERAEKRRERSWQLHLSGATQWDIARELGVNQAQVCRYIQEAAASHPVTQMPLEQRIALSEARWQQSEQEMVDAIAEQRANGRVTQEVIEFPDGTVQKKVTREAGVDPRLLRCLSTHHDRRARQLNNQVSPDVGVSQVNVNVVKDFLSQGETKGSLSAASWNETTIDASASDS